MKAESFHSEFTNLCIPGKHSNNFIDGLFYLTFSLFFLWSDNGDAQIKHLMMILSAVVLWIEPPDVIAASIRNGGSERSSQDPCFQALFNLRKKVVKC